MLDAPEGSLCRFSGILISLSPDAPDYCISGNGLGFIRDVYRSGYYLYAFRDREARVRKWLAMGRLLYPDFKFKFAGIYEEQNLDETGHVV